MTFRDEILGNVMWATVTRGGISHAAFHYWGDADRWMICCNQSRTYTDLQLAALDNDPTDRVCQHSACRRAHDAWQRLHAGTKR